MSNAPTKPQIARDASGAPLQGGVYFHLAANTPGEQVGVAGPVYLHAVIVGKTGSADWAVTIYDGTDNTGTVVSISDFNAGGSYAFDCFLSKGMYITASGTTAGDVTFVYSQ